MDIGQHHGSATAKLIWIVGSPVLFFVGVVGNIVTVLILSSRNQRKSSTTAYLTLLAVADLCVMVIALPRWWIIYVFEMDIRHLSNFVCKMQWFLTYFSGSLSTAILTTVTIEKVISTVKPYKVKSFCSVQNARIICCIILLLLFVIYGHVLYGMKLFDKEINKPLIKVVNCNNNGSSRDEGIAISRPNNCSLSTDSIEYITDGINSTVYNRRSISRTSNRTVSIHSITSKVCWFDNEKYGAFYSGPFQIINAFFYNILSEATFLIGGIIIIRKLAVGKKLRSRKGVNQTRKMESKTKRPMFEIHSRQITISLLLVNIVFVVCSTPVIVFLIGRSVWVDSDKGMTETQEITWAILNLMFYTNHAINFFLYFLSANRFRRKVVNTFLCKKDNKRNSMSLSQAASAWDSEGHRQSVFDQMELNAMKRSIEVFQDSKQCHSTQNAANESRTCEESSSEEINHGHSDSLCNLTHDYSQRPLSEGSHQNLHILLELRNCSEDANGPTELPITISFQAH